ncbi:hypothetical protein WJX72_009741 [[Myrmecia] bisecta]|uniref:Uncharacterized protein n=1 Tax=[Myrmecia] bisecta TaxID=41462 RepID=A0AAW1PUE0_9CHLO
MDVAMQSSDRALDGLLRPDQEDFKLDVIVPLTRIQSYLTEVAPEIVQTMEVQEIIPLIPVLAAHPDAKQGEELADRLQNAISTAKNRVHVPAAQACAAAAASVQSVQLSRSYISLRYWHFAEA